MAGEGHLAVFADARAIDAGAAGHDAAALEQDEEVFDLVAVIELRQHDARKRSVVETFD
ncbi:hypothetical protein D3C83_155110 [compost metagenome]